jgi:hypothetical protein
VYIADIPCGGWRGNFIMLDVHVRLEHLPDQQRNTQAYNQRVSKNQIGTIFSH